jgi:PAS domain S-box-containing protein
MEAHMHLLPKILIVDDEPRMCTSIENLLKHEASEIRSTSSGQEALEFLSKGDFDIVLLDIVIPDLDGFQVMDYIKAQNIDTFVIVITGDATLESAIGALRGGAYDYLRKPFEYDELLKTIQNAFNQKRLKAEVETINGKLVSSEERYEYLVQNSPDIIYTLDDQDKFTFISNAAERLLGFKTDKLVGMHYSYLIYEEDEEKARWSFNERRTGDRATSGMEIRLKVIANGNGLAHSETTHLIVELKSRGTYNKPITEKDKKFLGTLGVARDISDRMQLEARLQQAQKLEAIGTLAGGIAHDFNNLLMGIQGNASLMLLDINSSHPHYERLKDIEQQVRSGAELSRQLLGFARGGKYVVKPTDLNELIKECSEMFGRTKKEIRIYKKYQKDVWIVEVDQGQIEQVLLNIFVNAWQAMSGGGELYIQTKNVTLDEDYTVPFNVKPGKYVKVSITDTGVGMDEDTQKRIFDPFFTTKEMGRGTGLGLASAWGIVKNHSGIIDVQSKRGEGATFNIYLPVSEKELIEEKKLRDELLKGKETILFVDDEDMIIYMGEQLLENMGYNVLIARSGKEAIEIYKENEEDIDLVILDMVMPGIGGGEAYDRMKEINPNVKVLLSSGYSIDGQASEILERGCNGFIQKPFDIEALSDKIRGVLDKN